MAVGASVGFFVAVAVAVGDAVFSDPLSPPIYNVFILTIF